VEAAKFFIPLIVFNNISVAVAVTSDGFYRCSSNADVCPHYVTANYFDNNLTGLTITYLGDCEGSGRADFSCDQAYCYSYSWAQEQRILWLTNDSYIWRNVSYNQECLLTRE